MGRRLTQSEWVAFATAEEKLYGPGDGCLAFTDVRYREDSEPVAAMWDDAMSGVEMLYDERYEPEAAQAEVARRVAAAQYYLVMGEAPKTT